MDFGVLDGLVSSQNNKSNVISCGDLDGKPKWFGSGGGFCKQESSVTPTHEDEWRDLKMAKIGEDDVPKAMLLQQQRSQNMLSFSSPNTQSVTFPYFARNNTGFGGGGPFTPSQWMELEHQALIYKYIDAKAAIPSSLLMPIKKALENAAYSGAHLRHHNSFGWGALHLGFCNSSDPEPGRCRRTDGKKWRCAKDAVADQKYCERHMNRGRHRSRKPVEAQSCHSKLTANSAVTGNHTNRQPVACSQDNRSLVNMEATVGRLSSVGVKKNQIREEASSRAEFGVVCSDSLLNPMHKSDLKSPNPLHQFMEDWPHSNQSQVQSTSPNVSPLRMGLGMGGPLGEVLQHSTNNSPSGLNLMTEGWASQKASLGHLL